MNWACVDPARRVPMIACSPSQMNHHHVRFLHRLQSTTDAWRKTVRLGKSPRRHCRCDQHRKSALPTITTRESHLCTTFRTCWSRRPRSAPDWKSANTTSQLKKGGRPKKAIGSHTDKKPPCDQYCQINQRGLRGPSTCSNKQIVPTFGDETSQDKSTNGSMKPMLTARKKPHSQRCAAFD